MQAPPPMQAVAYHRGAIRGGLSNQLMSFVGLLLFAQRHNATVHLPAWSTNFPWHRHAASPTHAVWGDLHWDDAFPRVTSVPQQDLPNGTVSYTVWGWAEHSKHIVARRKGGLPPHPFETAFYTRSAVPRPQLQQFVDRFVSVHGKSYGALHARVEKDMRKHRYGKEVVGLETILGMIHNSTLEKVDVLFVAVGDAVLEDDAAIIAAGVTPWGGRLVRKEGNTAGLTYLDHAIIDMEICTHAKWFVGFTKSTFSLTVTFKRHYLDESQPLPSYHYNLGNITERHDAGLQLL